jgi:hypothetical protein
MQLHLAALKFDMILGALKCFVDILSLPATFILERYLPRGIRADLRPEGFGVIGAVGELLQLERLRALLAGKYMQVSPHLPVYLLP